MTSPPSHLAPAPISFGDPKTPRSDYREGFIVNDAPSLPSDATGQGYVSPTGPYKARDPNGIPSPQHLSSRLRQIACVLPIQDAVTLRQAASYIDQDLDDGK